MKRERERKRSGGLPVAVVEGPRFLTITFSFFICLRGTPIGGGRWWGAGTGVFNRRSPVTSGAELREAIKSKVGRPSSPFSSPNPPRPTSKSCSCLCLSSRRSKLNRGNCERDTTTEDGDVAVQRKQTLPRSPLAP